jgi:hypothetical protein
MVMLSPSRNFPPTNSLPPRLWPAPAGLAGIVRGEAGDSGGLRKGCSGGDRPSPGLKLKSGRADALEFMVLMLRFELDGRSCRSTTERGRLPVAREYDEGAEDVEGDAGFMGKTKCGFGGGLARGESWGEEAYMSIGETLSMVIGSGTCREDESITFPTIGASVGLSGPTVVAMIVFPSRAAALESVIRLLEQARH